MAHSITQYELFYTWTKTSFALRYPHRKLIYKPESLFVVSKVYFQRAIWLLFMFLAVFIHHSFKTPKTIATANNEAFWKEDVEKLSLHSFQRKRLAIKSPCPLFDPMLTLHIRRNLSIPRFFTRPLISSDKLIHSTRQVFGSYDWVESFSWRISSMIFLISCA